MGCRDDFRLPERDTSALKVLGDGVSPLAVAWLSKYLLAPLAGRQQHKKAA
jgi:site-specific DNA-cytosine methylase